MIIETFNWTTENSHANNSETLSNFLENKMKSHCGSDFTVFYQDDTYAEIINSKGKHYGVRASGNGDFNNHKVTFEFLV